MCFSKQTHKHSAVAPGASYPQRPVLLLVYMCLVSERKEVRRDFRRTVSHPSQRVSMDRQGIQSDPWEFRGGLGGDQEAEPPS